MDDLEFEELSELISKMERSLVPYHPYSGKAALKMGVKFSPTEYASLSYHSMQNFYSRIEKIRKTSELLGAKPAKKTRESQEAETAIKEISQESSSLSLPEDVSEKEIEKEIKAQKQEAPKHDLRFEEFDNSQVPEQPKVIETLPEQKQEPEPVEQEPEEQEEVRFEPEQKKEEIEFEKPESEQPEEDEFEAPVFEEGPKESKEEIFFEPEQKKEEIEFEDVPAPDLSYEEKSLVSPVVFESRREEQEKQQKKEKEIEKQLSDVPLDIEKPRKAREVTYLLTHQGPKIPEFASIQLNPEKVGIRKYHDLSLRVGTSPEKLSKKQMKMQMLSLTKQLFREKLTSEREKIKKEIIRLKNILSSTKTTKTIDFKTILENLPEELESEIFEYLSTAENLAKQTLFDSRKSFYSALERIDPGDSESREKAFELFSSDLSLIQSQIQDLYSKTSAFIEKMHKTMLSQIKQEGDSSEIKMCNSIILKLKDQYEELFHTSSDSLNILVELFKLKASQDAENSKSKKLAPLFETLDLTEDQLLNNLQSKFNKYYKNYVDKKITRTEALVYAIKMLSKEKGLSNELLKKYFNKVE